MNNGPHPEQIGQYQIKRLIATGGMGSVYEAIQTNPRRTVAVKVVRVSDDDSEMLMSRFRYEAQVLGRLRHPGIAEIYEAGTYEDDGKEVPYFAMEFIPNAKSLTEYAESEQLDSRGRLELFIQVCEAVHHGHQRGIVHRDLKPANILVDDCGRVKIIDFGVARATDSDLRQSRVHTTAGELIGSVQYMSPEQFKADSDDIDTRSDVYTLGVVLYELLTSRMPYDLRGKNIYEIAQCVAEDTPMGLRAHHPGLSEELDTIVQMSLRKERTQRYQSAHGLGLDVRRFMSGEAISARAPSFTYQFRVFARRNRAVVASATVAVLALVAGIALAVTLLIRVDAERAQAMAAKNFLTSVFNEGFPQGWGEQTTVETILDHARAKLKETDFGNPETEADIRQAIGTAYAWVGRQGVALKELETAFALYEEELGGSHPKSLGMREQLYYGYLFLQDHENSIANVDVLIDVWNERLGKDSEEALDWRATKVNVLHRAERDAEALDLCQAVYQDCKSHLGQNHLLSLNVCVDLAWLLMHAGRLDSAQQIARDVHSRATLAFGDNDAITRETRGVLAAVLIAQGELGAAGGLYGHWTLPDSLGITKIFQGDSAALLDDVPKLYIYFETWCPYSHNRVPKIESLYQKVQGERIEFIGLTTVNSNTTDESVDQFIRDWGLSFPIFKEDGRTWRAFGGPGTPTMFLVQNNQVIWRSGWNPTDEMLEGIIAASQVHLIERTEE